MADHDIAYKSSVYSFVHRKFCRQRKKLRQMGSPSRAQRLATMFETLKSDWRDDDAQRPRRNTEGKKYEEKKRTSDGGGTGSCRMAQQNHLTQREREMAKPTARIRGNRRVGAGFRLSVAIATSAALWLGERAADGKSLVRTIIPRVAILQSGPSRSVVLHPPVAHVAMFSFVLASPSSSRHVLKNLSLDCRFSRLYDVTIL